MGSVVTAQIDNRHNGDLVQREAAEGKRSLFDYVDGIVERVAATAAATAPAASTPAAVANVAALAAPVPPAAKQAFKRILRPFRA
ncbi:hypothetical protein LQW54_009247 [Pestalotiopsis sp. IQ-011]